MTESTSPLPGPPPTVVTGRDRRPIGFDSFTDITAVPVAAIDTEPRGVQITFAATLTDSEASQVWARVTSADDADRDNRAAIRNLSSRVAALPSGAGWTPDDRRLLLRVARALNNDDS